MKHTHASRIFCVLALVVVAAGCTESPTEGAIPAGRPIFDNGGSYGSGGRSEGDSVVTAANTGATTTPDHVAENGGSYGSGGMD